MFTVQERINSLPLCRTELLTWHMKYALAQRICHAIIRAGGDIKQKRNGDWDYLSYLFDIEFIQLADTMIEQTCERLSHEPVQATLF